MKKTSYKICSAVLAVCILFAAALPANLAGNGAFPALSARAAEVVKTGSGLKTGDGSLS